MFERQPRGRLGRDLTTAVGKPLFENFYARQRFLLAVGAAFFSRQALYLSLNTAEDFNLPEARLGDGGDIVDGLLEQFTPRMCQQ